MNEQDRQAIEGLFSRLAEAEKQAGPRDAEADAFIKERVSGQPGAPYMMAQTIVMQNYALEQAQQRIAELERQSQAAPANGGGIFGVFGGNKAQPQAQTRGSVPAAGRTPAGAQTPPPPQQPGAGGGFLAGAAQTAMGVAGGVLLANALGGMFGSDPAQAAPVDPAASDPAAPEPEAAAADPAPDAGGDEGGGFFDSLFGGGDSGDMDF